MDFVLILKPPSLEPGCVWHFAAEDKGPLLDTIDFAGSENHQESKSIL